MADWVATRTRGGRRGQHNDQNQRTYDREFQVQFTTPFATEAEALAAPNVPRLYHPHPADLGALVINVAAQQDRTEPSIWNVLVHYSTLQARRPDQVQIDNPLLEPPSIRWGTEVVKVAAVTDRDGNPIITASKETFDPPPEDERRRLVLYYGRNRQDFGAPEFVERWIDRVNETAWYGFLAQWAKVEDLTVEERFEKNVLFWREDWVIKIDKTTDKDSNPIGWAHYLLHQGYYEITGGQRKLITDGSGRALQKPSLLDADGAALPVGGTPTFRTYHRYQTADFNELGIP